MIDKAAEAMLKLKINAAALKHSDDPLKVLSFITGALSPEATALHSTPVMQENEVDISRKTALRIMSVKGIDEAIRLYPEHKEYLQSQRSDESTPVAPDLPNVTDEMIENRLCEMLQQAPDKILLHLVIVAGKECVKANAKTMDLKTEITIEDSRYEVINKITVKKVNK